MVEQKELEERKNFVLDYLKQLEASRTKNGGPMFISKQDVMAKLQSWLESQGKEWESIERIALPAFETPTLVHVFSESSQKITLAPISLAMDVGGENPSWHCTLPFYICLLYTSPSPRDRG